MERPVSFPNRSATLAAAGALALLAAMLPVSHARAQTAATLGWQYVSPVPLADHVSPRTNVILRPGGAVDPASVAEDGAAFAVTGSVSGPHAGEARLLDDGRTITFRPLVPFSPGEEVTCRVQEGLRTGDGADVPAGEFRFTVAGPERDALIGMALPDDVDDPFETGADAATSPSSDPLPGDFPNITATVIGRPSPGRIFLAEFDVRRAFKQTSYLMILENDGTPYWYRQLNGQALDFKMLPDGRLSYFDHSRGKFYAMDSTYADVDSFACGNGYVTDHHDLDVLPDGHALVMAYDPEIVDLTPFVPKGIPFAIVVGLIIQEIDRDKNVVFEWRSWDHFKITDIQNHTLNSSFIDYVHGNSLDTDLDGNIILSCRHMNEITKIDRATGDVIWRLGGKNSQFTFVDDPIGFSHQHDARILPDGHLTVFDNGNFHTPPFSRALEYELDARKMTATLVWQYRHDPDVFGPATGSVQRLPTGNTLIGWGLTTPSLTSVTPDGSVVSEMSFDPGIASYRAYRFDWPRPLPANVTILPQAVNLSVDGQWIFASVEAVGWNLDDLVPGSVRLDDTVPADSAVVTMGDLNGNGVSDLDFRFDRAAAAALLTASTTWLDVSGALRSGARFRGYDVVRVTRTKDDRAAAPLASPRLVSAPGGMPARIALPAVGDAGTTRTLAVYDVRGRLVRRWRADVEAGRVVSWDGRGGNGVPAPSGIYFVRAEDRAATPAVKVVIAR
ncbi:MAG TPA: aryl-sulfate sulfotransferase [Candidatus Eisenbacteria bacterium]